MDSAIATEEGSRYGDDDEAYEEICRICRNPGDTNNPLKYPCACNGSIKFVHQNCLFQWLNHSKTLRCEVCKNPISVSQVYAENTPTRLPFHEFVFGIAMRTCRALCFFMRLSFVLSVWFLAIPFVTFWIWRLAFVRSFGEAQRLFLSHISATVILGDCLYGFLLSASILMVFAGAIYYFTLRELGEQEEREEEGERNVARPGEANRNLAGEGNGDQGAVAGQANRNLARGVNVPLYELVGMQGPVFHLVENAVFVLACNMIFLGVVIFVPFTLGRVVLYLVSCLFTVAKGLALTATSITMKSGLASVSNLTNEGQENGLIGRLTEMTKVNGSELIRANNTLSVAADLLKGSVAGSSKLYDVTSLAVGYMFTVFSVSLYLGISSIVEAVPSLLRQFMAAMRLGSRVAFVVFVLGVRTMMLGWLLDFSTVGMFGKTMNHRVQYLSISPLACSLVHWVVGFIYMGQIFIFENLLRVVLRPGVLYFLRDCSDPNYNPFRDLIYDPIHEFVWDILLAFACYGSLIFILVFLPVQLAIRMAPSIFPLDMFISDPFTEIPAGMLLFEICVSFLIEHFRLGTTIKSFLRCWFTGVGWALDLTDFLLPRPEGNVGQDNGNGEPDRALAALPTADDTNRSPPFAGNVKTGEEYKDDVEQSDSQYNFVLRIILLLLVAFVTLLLFNSALIVVAVSLGRVLFSAIPLLPITHGIKLNDLYAFFIGTYAFWFTVSGARYVIEHVKSKRISVLFNQVWKWCEIIFKSSVLLAIWLIIIPVLVGLLFEHLVIVPIRVPVDESPVFLLYQDWSLGFIVLDIWTRLVIVDVSWRAKFRRVRQDGFSRLQGLWILREIIFPIVMKLLTALSVPYVLAKGVFPMLGYPLVVTSAVYRFAWIGCLSVRLFCFSAKRCHVWFRNLHNSIREDRYRIGQRLHNFGEAVGS